MPRPYAKRILPRPQHEARIQHYRWIVQRKFELFGPDHWLIDKVLRYCGVEVPE